MVFQEPLLFDTTVFNNVASGLKIRGMRSKEIYDRVMEQLDRFGISHLKDRSAKTLSGGEAQRTSLARAFVLNPTILLLDEPFASVDLPTRESLIEDLERILRETRTTAIFATHERLEALRLSDRIAVMRKGEILQIGTPSEVINQPINEFVASFVGFENIFSGKVTHKFSGTFITTVSGQEIEAIGNAEIGETAILCIHPENITISKSISRGKTSARNLIKGRIIKISPLGLFQKVQIDCGFSLISYVTNNSIEELSLKEGDEIEASFKATAVTVIKI